MKPREETQVVVVGAGFAGLHAAFSLRQALPTVNITVISKSDVFIFRPDSIYIPFGMDPDDLAMGVDTPLAAQRIRFVHGEVTDLDAAQRLVTAAGRQIPYDYLLIATGSEVRPQQVPGLLDHAYNVTSVASLLKLRRAFQQLVADAIQLKPRSVMFLVPPGTHFSGPIYEMAMLLDSYLSRQDYRMAVSMTVATWEDRCLQALGGKVHESLLSMFQTRQVEVLTGYKAVAVEEKQVLFEGGRTLSYDILVTCPAPGGSLAVRDLCYDPDGFIRTDVWNRQAEGQPHIYVAGDAATHDVKQAYVAYVQADVAAHHIISHIKGEPPSRYYQPHSRYILDGFDTAVYIDSSLDDGPVQVAESRLWHLSKQILGKYLPWKVRQGEPFTALFERPQAAVYPR